MKLRITTQILDGEMKWVILDGKNQIVSESTSFVTIRTVKQELDKLEFKSAVDIPRAPEPPPKRSLRRVYFNASMKRREELGLA